MSEQQRLAAYVHLSHPETQQRCVFGPDDVVPDWAVELITNPDAWAAPEEVEVETVQVEAEAGPRAHSKTELYAMDKEELVKLNEEAGIEASMHDTKKTLVENLTAR